MLLGSKTKLRALLKSDLEVLHKIYREPEIIRQLDTRADISVGLMEKKLESVNEHKHKGEWLVIEDLDGKIAGSISYTFGWKNDFSICDLYIDKQYQNNGLAVDAVARLCKFLFEEKKAVRIEAVIRENNASAIRVFEKSSFTHDGKRRKSVFCNGNYIDEVFMSYLAREYFI